MKAIVVGAGIAGLACAVRLTLKGYSVSVFEANAYPGGKLSVFSLGKYRFDAGPSLFTMPHFVTELFELAGMDPRVFEYSKKEVCCEYFWEDGTRLSAFGDRERLLSEVEDKLGVPQARLRAYLDRAQAKYERTHSLFLEQSLHRLDTYLSWDTLGSMARVASLEIGRSLDAVNRAQLAEPHLVQLYNRYATYNGSSPYQTPGIMTLVQHLEQHFGTFIPAQGMGQISQSIFELAQDLGVQFTFDALVDRILVQDGRAAGVQVGGQEHRSDLVVSNMDIVPTYRRLLPEQDQPTATLKQERSSSAVIFYWGINRSFPELDLHNIFFSDDYPGEFQAIFKTKTLHADPTIYVNVSSKDVPGDAPPGCENWFVMINAPHDDGQDWDEQVAQLRVWVLAKLERILGARVSAHIVEEQVMTPPIIQAKTQSYKGALYGASSNNPMAAFLRHPNFSRKIDNLYFCGGSVHPGGGIPLCLLSAKIVADLVPET